MSPLWCQHLHYLWLPATKKQTEAWTLCLMLTHNTQAREVSFGTAVLYKRHIKYNHSCKPAKHYMSQGSAAS